MTAKLVERWRDRVALRFGALGSFGFVNHEYLRSKIFESHTHILGPLLQPLHVRLAQSSSMTVLLCSSPGCSNTSEARLACPKCLQLGLSPVYFCSQDCFKQNYATHKKVHSSAQPRSATTAAPTTTTITSSGGTSNATG
jgi:zf-MYND-like zinc finger, mRNA-binding